MDTLSEKLGKQALESYGVKTTNPEVKVVRKVPRQTTSDTSFDLPSDPLAIPEFLQREHPMTYKNVGPRLEEIGKSVVVTDKYAFIESDAFSELVDVLHRTLGDTMEKAGVVWSSDSSVSAKTFLADMIEESMYFDGGRCVPISIGTPAND